MLPVRAHAAGAELIDYLLCAPVLLAGEDVPVQSLQGKVVRSELTLARRGPEMPQDLPVFPVKQWLQFLTKQDKARVRRLHLKDVDHVFRLENVTADIERAARMDQGLLASDRFDLRPFFSRGGKLLMWHGWSDPQVPAEGSIIYRDSVRQASGTVADDGLALFMLPGVLHCRGGPGADTFDAMAAITAWVEQGQAPKRIVASRRVDGKVVSTRALCPYPQVARYVGSGDTTDAARYTCAAETRPIHPPGG